MKRRSLTHAHGCVSTQPVPTARVEAEGTPAISRALPEDRHAPRATVHAPPVVPSGRHGRACGIADTLTRLKEFPAHSADTVFAPLQNYTGTRISKSLLA